MSSDKSLRSIFSRPRANETAPTLAIGQRRGDLWLLDDRPGPVAGEARSGGNSADRGEQKRRVRIISCDDGSGFASGVSYGRLCGGLYLGDDWPCVLLRAFEIVCVHDAPTTFMNFHGGNHNLYPIAGPASSPFRARESRGAAEHRNSKLERSHCRLERSSRPRSLPVSPLLADRKLASSCRLDLEFSSYKSRCNSN